MQGQFFYLNLYFNYWSSNLKCLIYKKYRYFKIVHDFISLQEVQFSFQKICDDRCDRSVQLNLRYWIFCGNEVFGLGKWRLLENYSFLMG